MLQLCGFQFKVTETKIKVLLISAIPPVPRCDLRRISYLNVFTSKPDQRLKWNKKWILKIEFGIQRSFGHVDVQCSGRLCLSIDIGISELIQSQHRVNCGRASHSSALLYTQQNNMITQYVNTAPSEQNCCYILYFDKYLFNKCTYYIIIVM